MEFVITWKYRDDSFEIKSYGLAHTFIWPSIGEYVEVENPNGGKDIYGEVIGIVKRYSTGVIVKLKSL